jgi:peptidoglycan/LPS O-acetylase OafA/YrhL
MQHLDALRGMAVLFVVFSHASNAGFHVFPFLNASGTGKAGVWLFFVLSAFLLTRHLMQSDSGGSRAEILVEYFIHRAFRIFPLYAVIIVFMYCIERFDAQTALRHLLLREGRGEYWAIPVEFSYYFIIPVLVIAWCHIASFGRLTKLAFVISTVALSVFLYNGNAIGRNSIGVSNYLLVFIVGSFVAILPLWRAHGTQRWLWVVALIALALVVLLSPQVVALVRPGTQDTEIHALAPIFALLWGALLFALNNLQISAIGQCLSRPFAFIGRISFSIYLIHMPILTAIPRSPQIQPEWIGAITLLASVFMSWITWRLIEQPGINLGRTLGRTLGQQVALLQVRTRRSEL